MAIKGLQGIPSHTIYRNIQLTTFIKKIINKKIIYKIMSLEQHNIGNIINYITSHNYMIDVDELTELHIE